MTNVISSGAPPARPMMEETADPPTIKSAGKLNYPGAHGSDIFGLGLVALVFGLLAVGPLLQAVLTSHGRSGRGLALNAAAGAASIAIFIGVSLVGGGEIYWEELALGWAAIWVFLAILSATIGSALRPRSRIRPRA